MATGNEIKRLRGNISAQKVADLIGIDVEKMRKWEQRDADPKDTGDIKAIESYFGCKLADLPRLDNFQFLPKEEKIEQPTLDYSGQPLIQVVLNLTYIGKKNADSMDRMTISMDKMADSNLQNSKSLAALVNLIASNSDLASLLAASPVGQHTAATEDDDLPVEAFLGGKKGTGSQSGKHTSGKKAVGHK